MIVNKLALLKVNGYASLYPLIPESGIECPRMAFNSSTRENFTRVSKPTER
jgi:hypothetical protein